MKKLTMRKIPIYVGSYDRQNAWFRPYLMLRVKIIYDQITISMNIISR